MTPDGTHGAEVLEAVLACGDGGDQSAKRDAQPGRDPERKQGAAAAAAAHDHEAVAAVR